MKLMINITYYTLLAVAFATMCLSILMIGSAHSTPESNRTQTQAEIVDYYSVVTDFFAS